MRRKAADPGKTIESGEGAKEKKKPPPGLTGGFSKNNRGNSKLVPFRENQGWTKIRKGQLV